MSVSLATLFAGTGVEAPDLGVTGISTSSRGIGPGGLFLACRGTARHGVEFAAEAVASGARAIAWEPGPGVAAPLVAGDVVCLAVPGLGRHVGAVADRFFAAPSAQLVVTGITGTNGKTTSAWLAGAALNAVGERCAYMGTLGWGMPGNLRPSSLTTPGCVTLHRRLRELADAGASHVVAEVSSHALDQGRVDGVRFRVAALTNLARDHLDYHGSMAAYEQAKARLFAMSGLESAVVNIGDEAGRRMLGQVPAAVRRITVAAGETPPRDAMLRVRIAARDAAGMRLELTGESGTTVLQTPMLGAFNAANIAVACGILLALDVDLASAAEALAAVPAPPGRMQRIEGGELQPVVIVDFAHTPDALGAALAVVREHTAGELWCVFGCGGNRDQGKRPLMGAAAVAGADHVVLTDDNPRDEDPRAIIRDIVAGTGGSAAVDVIPDRATAIWHAVRSAGPGDAVLIAGKGHETEQLARGFRRHFSDAETARQALGS